MLNFPVFLTVFQSFLSRFNYKLTNLLEKIRFYDFYDFL